MQRRLFVQLPLCAQPGEQRLCGHRRAGLAQRRVFHVALVQRAHGEQRRVATTGGLRERGAVRAARVRELGGRRPVERLLRERLEPARQLEQADRLAAREALRVLGVVRGEAEERGAPVRALRLRVRHLGAVEREHGLP